MLNRQLRPRSLAVTIGAILAHDFRGGSEGMTPRAKRASVAGVTTRYSFVRK
jgi:hypothetical protein